ncbi:MAG: hypothetical protein L6V93_13200 [Clostridiales bacterium]|nr:MAG: hypothetical protein L6V93_13200 [Clostridiales bacterium]
MLDDGGVDTTEEGSAVNELKNTTPVHTAAQTRLLSRKKLRNADKNV